jgi:uncharacterized protein (TIGR02145 family)
MKKFISISILFLMYFCANAQTWNIGTPNAADVTATLSNDTLYIRGSGNMAHYNYSPPTAPWTVAAAAQIRHIEVEEGITGIGYAAFCNLTNLVSVSFPTSLTSIASYSFMNCGSLLEVIIPENVTTLPAWAFLSCGKLEKIILPANFSKLDNRTFGFAYSIKEVHILNPVPPVFTYSSDATFFPFYDSSLATATLFVPCGSKDAYENAVIFQGFGNIEDCPPPQAGVSNVKAKFSCPGEVSVTYDLGTNFPTDATLYYSPDGGKTWLTAQTVTGDLTAQSTGAGKTIVWDSSADHVRFGKFKLKVEVPDVKKWECVVNSSLPVGKLTFLCYNLGADSSMSMEDQMIYTPTSNTDATVYGDLYQWGRNTDGHEKRTSGITTALSTSDIPGHGYYITPTSGPSDWRSPQNEDLWGDVKTANDPCPNGYRMPTEAEWESIFDTASGNNWIVNTTGTPGIYTPTMFLPFAGGRINSTGTLYDVGNKGYYWSADASFTGAFAKEITSTVQHSFVRAAGFSCRCIKE